MKARITLPCGTTIELEGTPTEVREAMPVAPQAPVLPCAPVPLPPPMPPVIAPPRWPAPASAPFWWQTTPGAIEVACGTFPTTEVPS